MFSSIFLFELRYRLVRPATYIYFGIFLLFTFLATVTDSFQISGGTGGNVLRNSPATIMDIMAAMSAFGIIVVSALMSTPVYRDFEHDSHHLFFSLPISKSAYLGGRFLGSFVITALVFLGLPAGIFLGSIIGPAFGWVEPDKFGPAALGYYLHPFLTLIVPNILFSGAIFFSLVTLTRKMVYAYLGNIVLIVLYIWTESLLSDLDSKYIASLLDPLGLAAIFETKRYWTTFENNNYVVPFSGAFLLNRLIWISISALIFAFTYLRFRFITVVSAKKADRSEAGPDIRSYGYKPSSQSFSAGNHIRQMIRLGWINFKSIIRELPFIAIVFCGIALLIGLSFMLQELYGTTIYPVTYALLEKTSGSFALFVIIIIVFYSGEIVWQERRLKMSQIYDALPVPNWLLFGSKVVTMVMIIGFLMLIIMTTSIGIQLSKGFTDIDFNLYLKELFYLKWYSFTLMAILALLIQTLVPDKFMGHFFMVVYYIINIAVATLGFEHVLYRYNAKPSSIYSEMNEYGHMLTAVNWMNLYWGMFAVLLALISNLFWVRGVEKSFRWRVNLAFQRLKSPARLVLAGSVAVFITVGAFVFYNTNILNKYRTKGEREAMLVRYEKLYKKYQKVPQPKVSSVSLKVDIYPEERRIRSSGRLFLTNRSKRSIDSVHINLSAELVVSRLLLNGTQNRVLNDQELGYSIYRLEKPLMPGDSIPLDFELFMVEKGFPSSGSNTSLVYNGTFVNNLSLVPQIGYSSDSELTDRTKRRKKGLKPRERMAPPTDSAARMSTYISNDGDWISFEATVSTSPDQIAIAPGYLQKEWTEKGRRYFHYKMDSPILNFYSFLSARYLVKKDKWKNVDLEIYYHKGHEYNLDKMLDAMKVSLEYYTSAFSPYQHRQVRIIEFPRYATFAQSFPNTIPYSENIGFIANLEKEEDIDYVYYVTAHEIAHQWWAHQVIGGNVQGSTLLSETLSQYSALMVMEKKYGKDKMKKFLKYELDRYLTSRKMETEKELPAVYCENQQYIHYNKGSVIMYALKDYIGEENLNKALSAYIKAVGFQNPPFTTSLEFLSFVRRETPDSLQYLIRDMFETITLYSNRTKEATWTRTAGGKYRVKLVLDSHKYISDSLGREKEIDFNDYIDIGVLGKAKDPGNGEAGKPLYLKKHRIGKGESIIEITVSEEPEKAGIDIYNKLIDRDSDDNVKKTSLPT